MDESPDLARSSAAELLGLLRARKVSARELCERSIARIEALDGAINAVVVRDFERAREDAAAADRELAADPALVERRLLGLPVTVKESYDLTGFATTWGLPEHRAHRASHDALAVQRLRRAGAVVLGKTNVPPLLQDWQSSNPIYGRTNNPHDLGRTPGGSSGGSAAAIALGFSALELGSDIGGSVRIPAAFCGVFGHKPSYGVIPLSGHAPGGAQGAPPVLGVGGPLARSADDLALALDLLAGPAPEDAAGYRLRLPPPRHARLADYRVLILDAHPRARACAELRALLSDLAGELERAGARVSRDAGVLPDLDRAYVLYRTLLRTALTRGQAEPPPISAHAWLEALDAQLALRRRWAALFEQVDVVVAPAFGTPAFEHMDEPDWHARSLLLDGEPTPFGAQIAWPSIATVANLPATTAPMGLGAGGLPLALQVIGPWLGDRTAIAFAGLIARPIAAPAARPESDGSAPR